LCNLKPGDQAGGVLFFILIFNSSNVTFIALFSFKRK